MAQTAKALKRITPGTGGGTAMPTFVGTGDIVGTTATATPGLPTGLEVDDFMLLVCETAGQTVTVPADWTQTPQSPQAFGTTGIGATRLTTFWKRFQTGDAAPTTNDPGNHIIAGIVAFRGVVPTGDPFDVTPVGGNSAASTSLSAPGLTTVSTNCRIVIAVSVDLDANSTTVFSNWANANLANVTEHADESDQVATGGGIAVASGEKAVAGATGTTTATSQNTAKAYLTFALKGGAGTPPPTEEWWDGSAWQSTEQKLTSSSEITTIPSSAFSPDINYDWSVAVWDENDVKSAYATAFTVTFNAVTFIEASRFVPFSTVF